MADTINHNGESISPAEENYSYYYHKNKLKYMRVTADLYGIYGEDKLSKKAYDKDTFFKAFDINHTLISPVRANRKIQKRIYNEIKDVTVEEYYKKVKKVLQIEK